MSALWLNEDGTEEPTAEWATGLENFVPALAYHFFLVLPDAFAQPETRLLADRYINQLDDLV